MDSAEIGVFDEGLGEVHLVDIRKRREPGEDIRELFLEILTLGLCRRLVHAVVVRQRGRELPELLGQIEECPSGPSGIVGVEVAVPDQLLELKNSDSGRIDG